MQNHTYHLGPAHSGRQPRQWEDLDENTKTNIAESMTAAIDHILDALQPMAESSANVMATWEQFVDKMSRSASVFKSIRELAESLRKWVPNWPKDLDVEHAWDITSTGIPLAFVPRPAITARLVAAADHRERMAIVIKSKELILQDCRDALTLEDGDRYPDALAMLLPLLREAMDALESGFAAAACALGVSVIDSALRPLANRNSSTASYATRSRRPIFKNL